MPLPELAGGSAERPAPLARSRAQRSLRLLLALCLALVAVYVFARAGRRALIEYGRWQGARLNRLAWEAGFQERGRAVPTQGPRDGYWGSRLAPHTKDPELGWVLPPLQVPGLLDVDSLGMQRVTPREKAEGRLLILGASTAFGGYASTARTTYFHLLAERLGRESLPVEIVVYATGAWKSSQELRALKLHGIGVKPDLVLFLDGLNDLTNGSNAHTLYGVPTRTLDGSRWQPLYNEGDFEERVRVYLAHMREAQELLQPLGVGVVYALQPSLFEKKTLSALEQRVSVGSFAPMGDPQRLRQAYAAMRLGLSELAQQPGTHFVDCSRVFDAETATTFTDAWHFSDAGHAILADALGQALVPIVRSLAGRAH